MREKIYLGRKATGGTPARRVKKKKRRRRSNKNAKTKGVKR